MWICANSNWREGVRPCVKKLHLNDKIENIERSETARI
jgi:hypothetical protein